MRFDLFKIVVTAALIFGLAFASAPYFAFRALRAATAAEDVQATAELVDFPAVRKSLTGQLSVTQAPASVEPPSIWKDPIGALKRSYAEPSTHRASHSSRHSHLERHAERRVSPPAAASELPEPPPIYEQRARSPSLPSDAVAAAAEWPEEDDR